MGTKVLVDKDFLEDGLEEICDEIRTKTGGTADLAFPTEIKQAVHSITSEGITPSGKKEITENGDDIDVTTYAAVKVNVSTGGDPVEQATPVISVSAGGLVTASATQAAGIVASGTESATHQLSSEDDADFQEANIKNGVTLFGKTGTYGADATAGASDVRNGKTFIGPDGKATGTMAEVFGSTFTPGTADRTAVQANTFVKGPIVVKGDPHLVSGNIKKNVEIFGVTGSYEGGGGGSGGGIRVRPGYTLSAGDTVTEDTVMISPPSAARGIVGIILSHKNEFSGAYSSGTIASYAAFLDTFNSTTRVIMTAGMATGVILASRGTAHATISDSGIVLRILPEDASTYDLSGPVFDDSGNAYIYTLICTE